MIQWNLAEIARLMAKRGIRNRKHLSEVVDISMPTAYAVMQGGVMQRIDVPTLEALTRALRPASPWALLEYIPDE